MATLNVACIKSVLLLNAKSRGLLQMDEAVAPDFI